MFSHRYEIEFRHIRVYKKYKFVSYGFNCRFNRFSDWGQWLYWQGAMPRLARFGCKPERVGTPPAGVRRRCYAAYVYRLKTVSYTHLTLPTSDLV